MIMNFDKHLDVQVYRSLKDSSFALFVVCQFCVIIGFLRHASLIGRVFFLMRALCSLWRCSFEDDPKGSKGKRLEESGHFYF